jgi:hypothetical protein
MKLLFAFIIIFSSNYLFAQNVHFFGSVKGSQTTIEDNDIEFDETFNKLTVTPLTTAGFSFDATIDDQYQVLAQFIYKNNSTISPDLLQLRHHFNSSTVARVGLQRLPTNLHSENIQIQALQPWLSAPREVYGRVPVYSFTGLSLEKDFGSNLGIHLYAGDTKDSFIGSSADYVSSAHNLVGARLNLKVKDFTGFVNGYKAEADLNVKTDILTAVLPGNTLPSGTTIGYTQDYKLESLTGFTAGAQYRPKDFFIMSEYSVISSDDPVLERVEGMYVTAGKEINEKWIPVVTFSTDLDVDSHLSPSKTTTYAFNVNYRLDYNNILKAGVEHVNYKNITVASPSLAGSSNASIFTNGDPGENFDVYSVVWAFVY